MTYITKPHWWLFVSSTVMPSIRKLCLQNIDVVVVILYNTFTGNMLIHLLLLWAIYIKLSTECLFSYTTRPIDGHYCRQTTAYKNSTDVSIQRCIGECIINVSCWILWYNHVGRYCLMASETCVSVDANNEFSMTILRTNETTRHHHQCIHWTSFSRSFSRIPRFLTRAIRHNGMRITIARAMVGTIARAMVGQDMLTGSATDWDTKLTLLAGIWLM